jgi:pilus assembly protein CpaB
MRMFFVIFAALLVAGGSGYYLLSTMRSGPEPVAVAAAVEAPRPIQVFVPAEPLSAGSILNPDMLQSMPVEQAAVTDEMIVADDEGRDYLMGSVARQGLARGVPIPRSSVVNPGDRGFLAAVLPRGKRAISITISEVAGLAGLVMPGDRVDIIVTYSLAGDVLDAERDFTASETILTNLRVLALDQRLQAGASITEQVNPTEVRPVARTATLEVTPQQAEMLTLATQLGELSLVLNSVQDGGDPETDGTDGVASAEGAPGAGPTIAPARRALTLDSEVTSLLKRELALMGEIAPSPELAAAVAEGQALAPLPERITRVQVVRGIDTRALEFSGAQGEAGAGGAGDGSAAEPAVAVAVD